VLARDGRQRMSGEANAGGEELDVFRVLEDVTMRVEG